MDLCTKCCIEVLTAWKQNASSVYLDGGLHEAEAAALRWHHLRRPDAVGV